MLVLRQLRLLLWKSAKTALRSPVWTLFEVLVPFLVFITLHYVSLFLNVATHRNKRGIRWDRQGTGDDVGKTRWNNVIEYQCEGANCASITEQLKVICGRLGCKPQLEEAAWLHIHHLNGSSMNATVYGSEHLFRPRGYALPRLSSDDYVPDEFRRPDYLDDLMDYFIAGAANLSTPFDVVHLQQPSKGDSRMQCPLMLRYDTFLIFLSLVPMLAAIHLVREISAERHTQIKDYLVVMGLSRRVYYAHHVLWALIKILPASVAVAWLVIEQNALLGIYFLLAFVLSSCAQLSLATLIPALIRRPTISTMFAFLLIPFNTTIGVLMPVLRTSIFSAMLRSLNPGHALAHAHDALREACKTDNYISLFGDSRYVLTLGGSMAMMIFDTVLFLAIAVFIDYCGSATENLFAWLERARSKQAEEEEYDLDVHEHDPSLASRPIDVELLDVHKTYPSGERAVRGVSMKLYRGQVTVLLGHNGAGKSTTFGMIAGITVPTAGEIRVASSSSSSNKNDSSDKSIGYCPQYNPIFAKLTVLEHLEFFAGLKGLHEASEWRPEGIRLMEQLMIYDKANAQAASLSGGMKRKLCIAISLIGKSRVVLLDEPTAGVDAGARRDIERMIGAQKQERTFLLTTHYTDEAEHLGDRIMIMAGGRLVCSGTSQFLNKEFGAGYILSCVVAKAESLEQTAQATLNLIQDVIDNAKPERQHGQQFEVWLDKRRSESFPKLFEALEKKSEALGIESYGLSNNTLEQVFLRVGELTGIARQAKVKEALAVLLRENKMHSVGFIKRFGYLLYKRFLFEKSELRSLFTTFLPILAFIFVITKVLGTASPSLGSSTYTSATLDLLAFRDCYRVGVERSLNLSAALERSLPPGSCVLVEEADDVDNWYFDTVFARRPIVLATIRRNRDRKDGLLIRMTKATNDVISALHLAVGRALSSTPIEATAVYRLQTPEMVAAHEARQLERSEQRAEERRRLQEERWKEEEAAWERRREKLREKRRTGRIAAKENLPEPEGGGEPDEGMMSDRRRTPPPDPMRDLRVLLASWIFLLLQPLLVYRCIGFYVVERTVKFAHQQFLTGLPKWCYWAAAFVSDLLVFSFNYSLALGCALYFGVFEHELWRLTPLCFGVFAVSIVKCYIFQRFFDSKSKAEVLSLVLLIASCIGFSVAHFSRGDFIIASSDQRSDTRILLDKIYAHLDPHVTVMRHLNPIIEENNFTQPHALLSLLAQFAVCCLLLALLESNLLQGAVYRLCQLRYRPPKRRQAAHPNEIPLLESGEKDVVLKVVELFKRYGSNMAVRRVGFTVNQHECFGLLGINGAGKTSVFEVITGGSFASSGTATVDGVDCATPAKIGYCPQFDALMNQLSGRQNLMILAALHGYANPGLVADTVIQCVGMAAQANKKSKSYSGGQRRKISVAAAMLAQNSLIVLDEPTAGIDPVTRRDIWSVICALRDYTNTAVLLTSHSMEEVEALCSRIAIMKRGAIVAQGTSQALKTSYGRKFKLTLVVEDKSGAEVQRVVVRVFTSARRMDADSERVHVFEIPHEPHMRWSVIFAKAVELAAFLHASDYFLTQASLEDAFIALTSASDPVFAPS